MNKLKNFAWMLLAVSAVTFMSCDPKTEDPWTDGGGGDTPGVETPPSNLPKKTIAEVKALYTGTDVTYAEDHSFVAVVVSDIKGNNSASPKNLSVVSPDNAAGIMVRLDKNNETFMMGDKIELKLKGAIISSYKGTIQLNNYPTANITKLGSAIAVTPFATKAADLLANKQAWDGRLITLEGTIESIDGVYGAGVTRSNTLIDASGSVGQYVNSYATTMKFTQLPLGKQKVTGFAVYNTDATGDLDLIIRNLADVVSLDANAPVIAFTSEKAVSAAEGKAFSFIVKASLTKGTGPIAIATDSNLPAGVTLTDKGDGTATLAGTPAASGTFELVIKATNATYTAKSPLKLTITPNITGTVKLEENFDKFVDGKDENSGSFAGKEVLTANQDAFVTTPGWTFLKVYQAGGAIKLGTSSRLGSIETPAIDLSANGGKFTLYIKAKGWANVTTMKIFVNDVLAQTVTGVPTDNTYKPFEIALTAGTATTKVRIEGDTPTTSRLLLDDLIITQ